MYKIEYENPMKIDIQIDQKALLMLGLKPENVFKECWVVISIE